MSDASPEIMSIFGDALECHSPEERAQYIERVCQGDAELRGKIEALLQANEQAGRLLRGDQAPDADATVADLTSRPIAAT